MKPAEIKAFVDPVPLRPFTVHVSNGARHDFRDAKSLDATRDRATLFFFGQAGGFVWIDTENIMEIFIEKP